MLNQLWFFRHIARSEKLPPENSYPWPRKKINPRGSSLSSFHYGQIALWKEIRQPQEIQPRRERDRFIFTPYFCFNNQNKQRRMNCKTYKKWYCWLDPSVYKIHDIKYNAIIIITATVFKQGPRWARLHWTRQIENDRRWSVAGLLEKKTLMGTSLQLSPAPKQGKRSRRVNGWRIKRLMDWSIGYWSLYKMK